MTWGPFHDGCPGHLRAVYLAEIRALVRVFAGPAGKTAASALTASIDAPDDPEALAAAQRAIDAIPSKPRRRMLASFAGLRREILHDH